ncbi:hypothetical protein FQA39_LY18682 [Lamprigera yunnana]|nr:hypothetical protein FQA39_LY18682 [Lamprigera yunnana]
MCRVGAWVHGRRWSRPSGRRWIEHQLIDTPPHHDLQAGRRGAESDQRTRGDDGPHDEPRGTRTPACAGAIGEGPENHVRDQRDDRANRGHCEHHAALAASSRSAKVLWAREPTRTCMTLEVLLEGLASNLPDDEFWGRRLGYLDCRHDHDGKSVMRHDAIVGPSTTSNLCDQVWGHAMPFISHAGQGRGVLFRQLLAGRKKAKRRAAFDTLVKCRTEMPEVSADLARGACAILWCSHAECYADGGVTGRRTGVDRHPVWDSRAAHVGGMSTRPKVHCPHARLGGMAEHRRATSRPEPMTRGSGKNSRRSQISSRRVSILKPKFDTEVCRGSPLRAFTAVGVGAVSVGRLKAIVARKIRIGIRGDEAGAWDSGLTQRHETQNTDVSAQHSFAQAKKLRRGVIEGGPSRRTIIISQLRSAILHASWVSRSYSGFSACCRQRASGCRPQASRETRHCDPRPAPKSARFNVGAESPPTRRASSWVSCRGSASALAAILPIRRYLGEGVAPHVGLSAHRIFRPGAEHASAGGGESQYD